MAVARVPTFGKFTFFSPAIILVDAKNFTKIVETWMEKRLLFSLDQYDKIYSDWQHKNQPSWFGPAKTERGGSGIEMAMLTTSKPFQWLDEGDDGGPITRKVRLNPATGATKRRTFKRVGPSKTVQVDSKGKKQFLRGGKYGKTKPRFWSRELIRREQKKLDNPNNHVFLSRSKKNPGIVYSFGQIAFAPNVTTNYSRGLGYKLTKNTFKY